MNSQQKQQDESPSSLPPTPTNYDPSTDNGHNSYSNRFVMNISSELNMILIYSWRHFSVLDRSGSSLFSPKDYEEIHKYPREKFQRPNINGQSCDESSGKNFIEPTSIAIATFTDK
jgi:hypothetical protein